MRPYENCGVKNTVRGGCTPREAKGPQSSMAAGALFRSFQVQKTSQKEHRLPVEIEL